MFVPIEERRTGHAAPTPIPIVIGSAAAKVIDPVMDSAWRIPTEAEALCKTAVNTIPTRIPINGFVNMVRSLTKCGFSFRGETAPLMVCIPIIRIAKPSMMSPISEYGFFLINVRKIIPMIATIAEIVAVDKSCAIPMEPSM